MYKPALSLAAVCGLLLGHAAVAAPPPSQAPSTASACAAALVALPQATTGAENTFYSVAAPGLVTGYFKGLTDASLRRGWFGLAPTTITMRELKASFNRSGLACDSVAALAATRGTVIAEDEGQARFATMGLGGRTAFLHRLSLPALDKTGMAGVVAVMSSSNQLAGGIELLFVRKVDGQWVIVGRKPLIMV